MTWPKHCRNPTSLDPPFLTFMCRETFFTMPLRLIVVKKLCRSNSIGSSTRLLSLTIMYYFLHKIQSIRQKISLSKTAILVICFSHFNFVVHSTEIKYICLIDTFQKNASKFAMGLDYEILCRIFFFIFCQIVFFVSVEHFIKH